MPVLWDKLDSSLGSRYGRYLREGGDARLLVSLAYDGDLAAIEAAGFETAFRGVGGYATGEILLSQLEQITEQPGVVRLSIGRRARTLLDHSVPQIKARPDVWDWDGGQKKFVPANGTKGTGKGVLIGVIDSGIDWQHPFFLKESEPLKVTRILSIWDIGLRPDPDEVDATAPQAIWLSGEAGQTTTYGVEYDWARIQAALNNGPTIRHEDTKGHGTHVASIAAGNGGADRNYIGVAPEAELIIVKILHLKNEQVWKNNVPNGTEISFDTYFKDAVTYILKKAWAWNRPVVINLSIGGAVGPRDGYTESEDWLTFIFNNLERACCVAGAGNDAFQHKHAVITFDHPGAVVTFEVELRDRRQLRDDIPSSLSLEIYYWPTVLPLTVALDPGDSLGFRDGPQRSEAPVTITFEDFTATITHGIERQPRSSTNAGRLLRSKITLEMHASQDPAGKNQFRAGRYVLRLESPEPMTAHLWSEVETDLYLKVVGPPFPTGVTDSDEFLIAQYGGARNVVTVAAYNHGNPTLPATGFSSRGPLVNYESQTDPHPVQKPDIAAPGEAIVAARSRYMETKKKRRKRSALTRPDSGTSMACPHVTGVVALMFENNPNLRSTEIVDILRNHGRDAAEPDEINEVGQGRVNAKKAFDKAPNP